MLVYRTAGGGGWKDRLDRPVEAVVRDVSFGLVSARARAGRLRRRHRRRRRRPTRRRPRPSAPASGTSAARRSTFDFGPSLEEVLANCKEETGLEPPTPAKPLRWSPLEPGDGRARAGPRRRRDAAPVVSERMRHDGFHGRAGFGAEARPARDRRQPRLHRPRRRRSSATSTTSSPRSGGCSTSAPRAALPVVYTTVSLRRGRQARRRGVHRQDPGAPRRSRRAAAGSRSTRGSRRGRRAGAEQAVRVGVLRHAARQPARRARLRQRHRHRRLDLGLRARDRRRRAPARLPARRARARRSATATRRRTRRTSTTSTRSTATSSRVDDVLATWRSSVPHTLAEKILLDHADADDVSPGDVVMVRCDVVMANDVSGPVAFRAMEQMGGRASSTRRRSSMVADHFMPAKDARSAELQRRLKEWSRRAGGDVLRPGPRRDRAHAPLRGGLGRSRLGHRGRRLAHLHLRRARRVRHGPRLDRHRALPRLRRVLAGGAGDDPGRVHRRDSARS